MFQKLMSSIETVMAFSCKSLTRNGGIGYPHEKVERGRLRKSWGMCVLGSILYIYIYTHNE